MRDGVVLPILHLNGYKIANPTVLARISHEQLESLFAGYGYKPYFVEGEEPAAMHQKMAATLDAVLAEIKAIQAHARERNDATRPRWPMIVMRTPKGWTGPKEVDGQKTEGYWRSHQVPLSGLADNPAHVKVLEQWMRSYRPEELFDEQGRLVPALRALAPQRHPPHGRQSPHQWRHPAQGPAHPRLSRLRDRRAGTRCCGGRGHPGPGRVPARHHEAQHGSGQLPRVRPGRDGLEPSGRAVRDDGRTWVADTLPEDDHLAPDGRVMEILSEHTCQGWLEGYLLTGRHGFFSCYEAFIHIIDSMFNQHAKWLKTTRSEIPWRRPIASLNYLLTSHVWRQDHNGFSHQDPGFIDHVMNKKASVIRVYLPPDANTLLSVADHCLRSRDFVNVIVAGKQPEPQWLDMDAAVKHCTAGIGIWQWASNDRGTEPDVVMAAAGDVPTMEVLAAISILRQEVPDLKIRMINVVDLMRLQPAEEHPHGLSDREFDVLFTADKPIIFAYHGYPWLIHRLTYRRTNHGNLHVRGYKEEGTTTTPFDMLVRNDMDRFHLVDDVIERVPRLGPVAAYTRQTVRDKLIEHKEYITKYGQDMPEIRNWTWPGDKPAAA